MKRCALTRKGNVWRQCAVSSINGRARIDEQTSNVGVPIVTAHATVALQVGMTNTGNVSGAIGHGVIAGRWYGNAVMAKKRPAICGNNAADKLPSCQCQMPLRL